MASFYDDPLRRRRPGDAPVDPFSDAARFPTLVHDQQDALRSVQSDLAGVATGGHNSVAGRFDPLDKGSIFSRQNPGLADSLRDAANPQPLQPRSVTAPQEVSATDRYAIDTGYQKPAEIAAQQGMNSIDRYAFDTQSNQRASLSASEILKRRRDPLGILDN